MHQITRQILSILLLTISFSCVLFFAHVHSANATYIYDFQFDELTFSGQTYAADSFSFSTAKLIGPSDKSDSFVENVIFPAPLDLNGFSFDRIILGAAGYTGSSSDLSSLSSLAFKMEPDFSRANGEVADFWVGIGFSPGSYGPGTYNSDRFGRGIQGDSVIDYAYANGSLTITDVDSAPVPEPSTLLLLAAGLGGLCIYRRKIS